MRPPRAQEPVHEESATRCGEGGAPRRSRSISQRPRQCVNKRHISTKYSSARRASPRITSEFSSLLAVELVE